MISRIIYFVLIGSLFISTSSCRVKRKEYIERNGLHSDEKPSEMAKDLGSLSKTQKLAYIKQLKRTRKAIKKRNQKKAEGGYYGNGK